MPTYNETPRRVAYTCLFGNYEVLNEASQHEIDREIRFICFTDNPNLQSETWEVRVVETKWLGDARDSRLPKLCPHRFLSDFDESLYIDNSMQLLVPALQLFERYLSDPEVGFACLRHPWRNCLYEEGEEVIKALIDCEERVREQLEAYRMAGHPRHAGLYAGTLLLRRHNDRQMKAIGELWYDHVLRYSARDQISLPFCINKLGVPVLTIDEPLDNSEMFRWPAVDRRIPYGFDESQYLWLNQDVRRAGISARQHMFEHGYKENRSYRHHPPLPLEFLANKFKSDKGRLYYNRHFYTRIYEHYLAPLKNEQFTFVEIGLLRHDMQIDGRSGAYNNAPSLFMWNEYFSQAQIHGIDIADFSAVHRDRITFAQADQSQEEQLLNALGPCRYDLRVVIDDASHASHHQQITFGCLFPKLASGGYYFIEDLHYQPQQWEDATAPKTRDLLRVLQNGGLPQTPFISPDAMLAIKHQIAEIHMFDSMDYSLGADCQDALAVIVKR